MLMYVEKFVFPNSATELFHAVLTGQRETLQVPKRPNK